MRRRIRFVVAAISAGVLLAACSSGDAAEDDDFGVQPIEDSEPPDDNSADDDSAPDPDDEANDEPEPDPEPEPEPDPFAIPEEIDEGYVDLIMNELLSVHTTTLHDVLAREPGGELAEEDFERIRAVFSGPQLIHIGENFVRYAAEAGSREAFLPVDELSDLRWETRRVVEVDDSCLIAIGYYDLREVSVAPFAADEFTLVSLAPDTERDDPARVRNRTPWRIHDMNLLVGADDEPIPEDVWDQLNYADALETTCKDEGDG